ncbi:MAG TPA: hypothetical protein DIW80_06775 [Gordonia polyisoprenivorans]|uniref:hypothetical protein n=1 Tax=uncultured Gordonia sp. TaxID=198437 RepID=UPI000EE62A01|nr:hypothetical protein [uncultured Gordonia sp.]HCS56963.1 hypothetical protein [Gordonia polyisoprenivorans]
MFVMTIDQRRSRTDRDRVPDLLTAVADTPVLRPFDRTAGDEVQAVLTDPDAVVAVTLLLADEGHWSIGIGIGDVETPLPAQTRAGRGEAFEHARAAVEAAKAARPPLAVRGASRWAEHADTALRLLTEIVITRSAAGREAVSLVRGGLRQTAAAEELGITPQAMSQRLRAARWELESPTRDLVADLLARADRPAEYPR